MNDFLNNLNTLSWWMSVVIVGILVNLLSAFLYRKLDVRFSKLSSWWRSRSEAKKVKRLKELSDLRGNPHKQVMVGFKEMRHRSRAIMYLVYSVLFLGPVPLLELFTDEHYKGKGLTNLIIKFFLMLTGTIAALVSSRAYSEATYLWGLLIDCKSNESDLSDGTAA